MGGWAVEFEFIEDESGNGKFVSSGNVVTQLHTLLGRGQVEEAARVYEELGQGTANALFEEAKVASMNTRKQMAEMFRRARDFAMAARILELNGNHGEAATLHEQSGDYTSAARCFRAAGDQGKAAAALERTGELDQAAALYKAAGATDSLAEVLVRQGRYADAAGVYRQLGNLHAEVEMLRQVPMSDPQRIPVAQRLAALMEQYGHHEKAITVIDATFRENEPARRDPQLQQQLIRLLEKLGRTEDANKVRAALGVTGQVRPQTAAAPAVAAGDHAAQDYAFLKAIPIFGDLALSDMRDLFRVAQEIQFQAGAALIEQGQPSLGLTVITSGTVDVVASVGGSTRLLNELSAGAYVGEIGLVGNAPASARVTAKGPVRALFISKPAFEHYLYNHPAAATVIYKLFTQNLADRVRALSERN